MLNKTVEKQDVNEANLEKKIKEIQQDYKDYPRTGSSEITHEHARELAQIRMEVESKYGEYRNDIKTLKSNAITCSFFDYWTKYPESIFKNGGCDGLGYDPMLSSTPQECAKAESEIKYIMEGKKCDFIKDQKNPISFFKCQEIAEDYRKLKETGLNGTEAHKIVNFRYKNGKY